MEQERHGISSLSFSFGRELQLGLAWALTPNARLRFTSTLDTFWPWLVLKDSRGSWLQMHTILCERKSRKHVIPRKLKAQRPVKCYPGQCVAKTSSSHRQFLWHWDAGEKKQAQYCSRREVQGAD